MRMCYFNSPLFILNEYLFTYHSLVGKLPDVFRKRLAGQGFPTRGRPGGWAEVYRAFTQCKFVEDEGDVVFYKNAFGLAQTKGIINDNSASDSGVEMIDKDA
ncbi:hypothetical protein QCA50_015342 [Cerrena zonata]|uniref:Uncharacterized protein n=1 Tax=Cerrena zonata TaxID=2478898 RepID=A0AAW0FTN2_9APHY